MKKILVTGASGFVGRQVVASLKQKDCEIHAVAFRHEMPKEERVHWHSVNLFDQAAVSALMESVQPSHLMHFAWITTPGKYLNSLDNLTWVEASLHLLKSFAKFNGKRVILAGTCMEYEWNHSVYSESKTPFRSASLYGASKRGLFSIAETFCRQFGISMAWGYIFYLFGPHEHPDRFVPFLIRGLLEGREIPLSHGEQIRDFLDVRELADAFVELMDSSFTGAMNLGSGEPRSLKSIGMAIASKIGNAKYLQFGKLPPRQEPMELIPDLSLQRLELKWAPRRTFDESLKEVIEWWAVKSYD
jgi:nucleoside-diphosphate-sugar epimerase